jgi:hypothetical protein
MLSGAAAWVTSFFVFFSVCSSLLAYLSTFSSIFTWFSSFLDEGSSVTALSPVFSLSFFPPFSIISFC